MKPGSTVLLTGATDGIGFKLLQLFAGKGASVIGTGSRPVSMLPRDWPTGVDYIQADLSHPDGADTLRNALAQKGWSGLDHLVLNAGYGRICDPQADTAQSLSQTISVNLLSPILIAHALEPLLSQRSGLVTLIGSTARKGSAQFAAYAASKAGLAGFARALASEWQGRIGVQIIHPGPTATQMHAKAGLETGFARRFFVSPENCAGRILRHVEARTPVATVGIGLGEIVDGLAGRRQ